MHSQGVSLNLTPVVCEPALLYIPYFVGENPRAQLPPSLAVED